MAPTRKRVAVFGSGFVVEGPARPPGARVPLKATIGKTAKGAEYVSIGIRDMDSFREGFELAARLRTGRRVRAKNAAASARAAAANREKAAPQQARIQRAIADFRGDPKSMASILAKKLGVTPATIRRHRKDDRDLR
jgi:hypothetical protein